MHRETGFNFGPFLFPFQGSSTPLPLDAAKSGHAPRGSRRWKFRYLEERGWGFSESFHNNMKNYSNCWLMVASCWFGGCATVRRQNPRPDSECWIYAPPGTGVGTIDAPQMHSARHSIRRPAAWNCGFLGCSHFAQKWAYGHQTFRPFNNQRGVNLVLALHKAWWTSTIECMEFRCTAIFYLPLRSKWITSPTA